MKQILIIHGGSSFSSYEEYRRNLQSSEIHYDQLLPQQKWKSWIAGQIEGTDVLAPTFPNSSNAVYDEWVIYFEKILPLLGHEVQIVGHSLGAMFLTKYLNDAPLKVKLKRLILVSGGYNNETTEGSGSFKVSSAKNLFKSAREIHLFHSKDDLVVPFSDLSTFQTDLPEATSHIFNNRGHFTDETFPEIVEILKR